MLGKLSVESLETNVREQISKNSYDKECNSSILKYYQFHPESTKPEIVSFVLIKGLMQLPSSDFLQYTYLLSNKMQQDSEISELNELAQLLETGKFSKFWTQIAEKHTSTEKTNLWENPLSNIPGFITAVRQFIAGVIKITYTRLNNAVLQSWLNLEGEKFMDFVKEQGWSSSDDSVLIPPSVEENIGQKKRVHNIGTGVEDILSIIREK